MKADKLSYRLKLTLLEQYSLINEVFAVQPGDLQPHEGGRNPDQGISLQIPASANSWEIYVAKNSGGIVEQVRRFDGSSQQKN